MVYMQELIFGASIVGVIETDHVGARKQPVHEFQVPPGSMPEDITTISEGWTPVFKVAVYWICC